MSSEYWLQVVVHGLLLHQVRVELEYQYHLPLAKMVVSEHNVDHVQELQLVLVKHGNNK